MFKEKALFYSKWFKFLFWLVILGNGMSLVFTTLFLDATNGLLYVGEIVALIVGIVYSQILQRMASHDAVYHKAGLYLLWATVLSFVSFLFSTSNQFAEFSSLFTIAGAVISYLAQKEEFLAHEQLMLNVDVQLSKRWGSLWTWTMRLIWILIGNLFVALVIPLLSLMVSLVASIAIIVLIFMKIAALYKSADCMRKIGFQPMSSSSQSDENQL